MTTMKLKVEKLSWEETAREMAASREDWSAWDTASADGLDDLPRLPMIWSRRWSNSPRSQRG